MSWYSILETSFPLVGASTSMTSSGLRTSFEQKIF